MSDDFDLQAELDEAIALADEADRKREALPPARQIRYVGFTFDLRKLFDRLRQQPDKPTMGQVYELGIAVGELEAQLYEIADASEESDLVTRFKAIKRMIEAKKLFRSLRHNHGYEETMKLMEDQLGVGDRQVKRRLAGPPIDRKRRQEFLAELKKLEENRGDIL